MAYAEPRAYPLCFTLPQALTEHTTDKIDTSLRCALCARRLSRCAPVDQYGTSATAAFDASLAGMPSRPNTSSAGSTPLSSAEARAAQPASLTCAGYRPVEVEQLELRVIRQPLLSSRRRRRTCRQRRRHEGGKALVAERVASEKEILQRGVGEY